MSSTILINGKSFTGKNIQIINNNVTIDGKTVTTDDKVIIIRVMGDLESLQCDNANEIIIEGNVLKDVKTTNGDVNIEDGVGGNVTTTNGDVFCGYISGNVQTKNGDINTKS